MKRRRRRRQRLLVLLGAVAVLAILLIVLISSCAKKNDGAGITAKAFQTGSELKLPLEAELNSGDYVSYGGYQFETGKKLSKMAKLITKNNENVTATSFENAYGAGYLFTRDTGAGIESWCLYEKDPANISKWYVFMGMHRELSLTSGTWDILLPLHLISDSYLKDNMGSRLSLDTAYACGLKNAETSMQEQFKSFYADSGLYSMVTLENGFILADRAGGNEVEFSFEENEDAAWFTIKSTELEEPEPSASVTLGRADKADFAPVSLSESDAITLSTLLLGASYKTGTAATEYPYQVSTGGAEYLLELTWKDDTWSASVQTGEQTARLTTKQACTVAAIFGANGVMDLKDDESAWPSDAGEVTPMGQCMVTTNDVNVRSMPTTDSNNVLMTMLESSAVAVSGKTENGWCQIIYNDQFAYMSADYLRAAE